ncbi:FAD binding domain-containing protein [Ramlibacter alkalitolerans]|uniref:Xanthine dehydrogenase family protein subunit M n=1 Tax=Ramlibacter alkalitolerans TaxID=2039631 RepID=A0ABS1JW91_9BURK|nr:xanthine dehydrogenase family protein subunit M [Ramlibacter alkalitolerans]MBL0428584.1 xanthine dehydrogenase family protein subunit M [Ramlibacter alkalitolerans]
MKAPDFDYVKARSVAEALELLARHGDDARILAGGQTLLAALNLRLSEPKLLIDIGGLAELRGIERRGERLHIGALTTHSEIEASPLVAELAPLLCAAAPHIGHRAIRNAGTWGGSLAHADPASEWPCCLLALDGVVTVRGRAGERRIPAADFFRAILTTALAPDELLVDADVPIATSADWFGFDELARRRGDYGVAGLAVAARFQGATAQQVRLAFLGMGATPLRARRTEALLAGQPLTGASIELALAGLQADLDPFPDLHHSAAMKQHLAGVLARRLLSAALASRAALAA